MKRIILIILLSLISVNLFAQFQRVGHRVSLLFDGTSGKPIDSLLVPWIVWTGNWKDTIDTKKWKADTTGNYGYTPLWKYNGLGNVSHIQDSTRIAMVDKANAFAQKQSYTVGIKTDSITSYRDGSTIFYYPDQGTFFGSLALGDGGKFLSHTVYPDGEFNSFIGIGAGLSNTYGYSNTFMGYGSGNLNTIGYHNTGLGMSALALNTEGNGNTGIGAGLVYNTTGSYNTGVGYHALLNNTTASYKIGIGYGAGLWDTTNDGLLFINSYVTNNIGEDTTESIIYGKMDFSPISQRLYLNANVFVKYGLECGAITDRTD